jgi:uncharacterized protein (TIGR00288 family)
MRNRKIVLLIDAENTSARYAKRIMEYLEKKGDIICARIYGDFINNVSVKGWNSVAIEYEMEQKQQLTTSAGKNSSDIALVIDAMDLLYQKSIDTLCIVTSDGDFTGLVKRIREDGIEVIGMGKADASKRLEKVCDQYLDIEELEEKPKETKAKTNRTKDGGTSKAKDAGKKDSGVSKGKDTGKKDSGVLKGKDKAKAETSENNEKKTDKKVNNGGKTDRKTNRKEKEQKEKGTPETMATKEETVAKTTAENGAAKENNGKKQSKVNTLKVGTKKSVWGTEPTKASDKKADTTQSAKADTTPSAKKTSVPATEKSAKPKLGEIKTAIRDMVQQEEKNGKHAELGGVKSQLQLKYPGFDEKDYGYKTIRELIEQETKHEIVLEGRHTYVIPKKTSLKDRIRSKKS